jgi:hypothetical protein
MSKAQQVSRRFEFGFVYVTRVEHPYEVIAADNLRDYFASIGVPTREIVLALDGAARSELAQCLNGDAIAVVGFNWHLDHSCIGDTHFLGAARSIGHERDELPVHVPVSLCGGLFPPVHHATLPLGIGRWEHRRRPAFAL